MDSIIGLVINNPLGQTMISFLLGAGFWQVALATWKATNVAGKIAAGDEAFGNFMGLKAKKYTDKIKDPSARAELVNTLKNVPNDFDKGFDKGLDGLSYGKPGY